MTRPITVFHELIRRVREQIQASYVAGESLPSQRALAELFGASQSTMHRTLQRLAEEGLVEARPRANWVRAGSEPVKRKGRPPKRAVRLGLITRRSRKEFESSKVNEPYRSIYAEAELRGWQVITHYNPRSSHPTPARNRIDWPLVPWVAFDIGLLVEVGNPLSLSDSCLRRRRVLAVDQDARIFGLHSVSCDDRGAGREAALHLWQLGHRRFSLMDYFNTVGWPVEPTWLARRQGFEEAVLRWGGALHPNWRVATGRSGRGFDPKALLQETIECWSALPKGQRPTALLATDTGALALLAEGLQAKGILIPRDLSVIGFNWRAHTARGRKKAGPLTANPRRKNEPLPGLQVTAMAIDAQAIARRALDVAHEWFEKGEAFLGSEPRLFTAPFVMQHGDTVRPVVASEGT